MCDNKHCNSNRIAFIHAEAKDLNDFSYAGIDRSGYLPEGLGIGDDEIDFSYCLDCGKIQGKFPITDKQVCKALDVEELVDTLSPEGDLEETFWELHKQAEVDIEAMQFNSWKQYRRIGAKLEEQGIIQPGVVIK